jgi:hypothetical protein
MIVAAHQPHYLPWLGYLDKVGKADVFVVMDDLQFEAQNFQNRQRVKLSEGPSWLTVPVRRGAQTDRILEKMISPAQSSRQDWRHRHWLTLRTHYARAPYFAAYADELHDAYTRSWSSLVDLDLHMLSLALRWFDIRTPILRSSRLHLTGTKTDRLIDLCKKLGARCYLSGAGGAAVYLDAEKMGRSGIGVIWQQFAHPIYPQSYPKLGFVSHLGFLDLLLNCGPASRDILFGASHPARLAQPSQVSIAIAGMEAA